MQFSLFGDTFESEFQSLSRMIPAQESDYVTHNIHPYPAKFLPHFPRLFIKYYSNEGDLVVDPMTGSGTTLIEACLQKRRAYGVDIDPIAILTSRVSITPLSDEELSQFESSLKKEIRQRITNGGIEQVEIPSDDEYPNLSIWFREEVIRELLLIRDTILSLEVEQKLKDFALLCLSVIVKPVSNADPRDIFPERDAKNLVRERKDTIAEFLRAFYDNSVRVRAFTNQVGNQTLGQVCDGDARSLQLLDNSAKLVFTSPPYAYAMDYARVHQLSTLLFIMKNKEFREHRRKYIGTDRISVKTELSSFEGIEFAHQYLQEIYQKDKKLGIILYQYFSDMHKVTQEAFRVLKPGGHLIYVVGNSTVRGTPFRTDEVFIRICEEQGFDIEKLMERPYFAYRMARKRNTQSNTIKSDVFIIARKP